VTGNGLALKELTMSASVTILHPTDLSNHANHAFALACSLARASQSQVLVLHVMPISSQTKRYYREEMEGALQRLQAQENQLAVEHRLEEGDAAPGILRVAQAQQCGLIVMGTQGQTGLARLLMGSVAEQIVRNASCPVVTVKAPPLQSRPATAGVSEEGFQGPVNVPVRTILHPTDFSERCEAAFRVACSLAKDHAARVIVVHVAEPPVAPMGMAPSPPLPEGHRGGLEEQLCRFQGSAPEVQVECRVEEGDAATGIVRAARATESDLIVMGTHGRTGLGRLLMGSVAEQVLRTAPCPVATVKAPQAA
jgi:nucleotide-binding universal stress UspA family protein